MYLTIVGGDLSFRSQGFTMGACYGTHLILMGSVLWALVVYIHYMYFCL